MHLFRGRYDTLQSEKNYKRPIFERKVQSCKVYLVDLSSVNDDEAVFKISIGKFKVCNFFIC